MNEEFSTLKEMVPACKENEEEGNKAADWHKLAILQASIDYIRYLEQCVSDLKGTVIQHSSGRTSVQSLRSSGFLTTALSMGTALHLNQEFRRNEEPAAPSYPTSSSFQAPSENPLMQQYHQQHQHYSFNSSPNLGPLSSPIHSHFSSPAILPHSYQGSVDSGGSLEAGASEALLLLNRDRRRSSGKSTSASPGQHGGPRSIQDPTKSGKALSVRDLLAS